MPRYRLLPGAQLRMPDGSIVTAPAEVDLATDVAAMHAALLEPVGAAAVEPARAPSYQPVEEH